MPDPPGSGQCMFFLEPPMPVLSPAGCKHLCVAWRHSQKECMLNHSGRAHLLPIDPAIPGVSQWNPREAAFLGPSVLPTSFAAFLGPSPLPGGGSPESDFAPVPAISGLVPISAMPLSQGWPSPPSVACHSWGFVCVAQLHLALVS